MKCNIQRKRREREKKWQKKAWKELGKKKVRKPAMVFEPVEPKKISWFKKLLAWLKTILKKFKGRKKIKLKKES